MKKTLIILFILISGFLFTTHAQITTEEIEYRNGETTMKGFLAYDASSIEKRPGILVVHEWWGHNDYARKRAKMLAELGYVAFAVDMYGDGKKAEHPEDAGKFAGEVMKNFSSAKERFNAGMDVLKDFKFTDDEKIGAIGYCFGGGIVLNMARTGAELDGVVSFHGSLNSAVSDTDIKGKILVCNGADDGFVPAEQIETFKKEMEENEVDYKFVNYEGAKHSFTSPDADKYAEKFSMPIAYNKEADEKSWADMKEFFNKVF
ncbi:MAG: dienelactone hydrolase [Melioribacteraceae bacterium]|nr:MAG: dienelactone hydrolase [Melioribacteraceae bacterium]